MWSEGSGFSFHEPVLSNQNVVVLRERVLRSFKTQGNTPLLLFGIRKIKNLCFGNMTLYYFNFYNYFILFFHLCKKYLFSCLLWPGTVLVIVRRKTTHGPGLHATYSLVDKPGLQHIITGMNVKTHLQKVLEGVGYMLLRLPPNKPNVS